MFLIPLDLLSLAGENSFYPPWLPLHVDSSPLLYIIIWTDLAYGDEFAVFAALVSSESSVLFGSSLSAFSGLGAYC